MTHPQIAVRNAPPLQFAERRRAARIAHPFKVTVYGADGAGKSYEFETVLENISSGGLCVKLPELFEGAELLVVCRLAQSPGGASPAPLVALHGTVVRTEERPLGGWGHALKFTCTHFL